MKWLAAGLTFVNFATLCGLLFGKLAGGLGPSVAFLALFWGAVAAAFAYFTTNDPKSGAFPSETGPNGAKRTPRRSFWFWVVAFCFACFAFRCFCWLLFSDGEFLRIQSPNNLGDLALHIAYIRNFANGVSIWPDNPIYVFSHLRYPAGIDVFNALFVCLHFDLMRGLVWTGLLASLATFYGFYRWGGVFGVAGFLFNGGLSGFQFFRNIHGDVAGLQFLNSIRFVDYQTKGIVWKSIPLALFVTQRGLLYAIPAGLLLLWHWREKFFRAGARNRAGLPFWLELSLYASMPLFHIHTFIALSIVLAFLFLFECLRESAWRDLFRTAPRSRHLALLVGSALLPATFFVWLVSDNFNARSILAWEPWLFLKDEFAASFAAFWLNNFGLWIPLAILLLVVCLWRLVRTKPSVADWPPALAFLLAAVVIFGIANFIKLAPWEWDNTKILIWAYFIALPFIWSELVARWDTPIRAGLCTALFTSGFVSLFGGLSPEKPGYEFASRGEVYTVDVAVRKLPVEARFAAFPIYNHPLLLNGRKVVMGYPGHLWTQGFAYEDVQTELTALMQGEGDWLGAARHLGVRYIFWGQEEKTNYPASVRPWEGLLKPVNYGNWGAIYDLQSAMPATAPR